ncbi:MAG: hypothetical protein ABIH23_21600 [bacterium]
MNRARIFIAIFLFVGFGFVVSASAQVTAVRTLPGEMYLPGERITITIEVTGDPGAIIVLETPPADWSIRALGGGQLSEGVITWNLESFDGSTTLKYYATPPSTATGEALFSGVVGDQEIGGMSRVTAYEVPADVRLPHTTGPYEIGTFLVHLIDESREEKLTRDDPKDKRELMVQVWYPADIQNNRQPGLIYPGFDAVQPAFEAYFDVPNVFCDGIRVLTGNAVWDAPLLSTGRQYPILIFSHGHTSWRHGNVYLLEELASHGYVVASIDHTYDAAAVQFPDGRIISTLVGSWRSYISLHVQDVRFVLDQLEVIGAGPVFESLADVLNFDRVGVLGMSLGGAVTTQTLQEDPRFKAGVVLDEEFVTIRAGIDQSAMFLYGSLSPGGTSDLESALRGGGYTGRIRGTVHIDFSEGPFWWRLFSLPGNWPSSTVDDPVRVTRIIADYTVAFFDKILKGRSVPLLDGPSADYPEVEFTVYGDPQGLSGILDEEWALY